MQAKELHYPFDKKAILQLRVGDKVEISGKLFTARDAVHKYLCDGNPAPVSLQNQIIYHCGPVVLEKEDGSFEISAAGPTTSIREEPYQWQIMRNHGIVGVIGKGGMGERTLAGNQEYGCVYFNAVGGAAQVLGETIKSVDGVYLKEKFGTPEAIWELTVEKFPALVTMDAHGNSLHTEIDVQGREKLEKLL